MHRRLSPTLAVRLDNPGDVLLSGPAVQALAATAVTDLLVSPHGRPAAELLPGVREVLEFDAPWSGYRPPAIDPGAVAALVARLTEREYRRCVVFTSFHQSPLPMALLARLAGIPFVAAACEDYPGSLLDLRHHREGGHEVTAAVELAVAAGGVRPEPVRLAIRRPLPAVPLPPGPYLVLHPGASVPARALAADHARAVAGGLVRVGWTLVVTGGPAERELCAGVVAAARRAGGRALDLSGRTTFAELASVLAGAACVVVGNTAPAHLAAAVDTPVVSLFSPVVPPERWAPWGRHRLLGEDAACAGTRARECPVPGHPCLSSVAPSAVVAAVGELTTRAEVRA